jgi:hypothetical protein
VACGVLLSQPAHRWRFTSTHVFTVAGCSCVKKTSVGVAHASRPLFPGNQPLFFIFLLTSAMTLILLGAAWTFAIFAGTAITNVPNVGTYLLGDVGTFPGNSIDGFPPGVIYGQTYLAGSYAEIVIGDIRSAYNNATAQASTQTLTDTDLGGLTLFPGVYKFDAAAALSAGQLFFDAQGDVDAVWIFQITTSLNVESGTAMFFTSGLGNANNVYWAVGSSATLKEDVTFIGNILAYTSISCNARVSVNGRLLATNGGVTLIQNVVSYPDGMTFSPSISPSKSPSLSPTLLPSVHPSIVPTLSPSSSPSVLPTPSPSVDPTIAPSSFPTTPFVKKSQSNGISQSNVILASVLGSIGGLIVLGLIVVAAVYFASTIFRGGSGGGGVASPEDGLPMPELHALVSDSEVV